MGRKQLTHDHIVKAINSYIQEHLQEPLTIQTISKHIGYSARWIQVFYKKETGENLFSCLLRLRIETAKNLLLTTDLNVTEIAFEVGFNSHTRFGVAFRERENLSPTEFRKQARLKGEAVVSVPVQQLSDPAGGRELFRAHFTGDKLQPCWKPEVGNWTIENGMLSGRSSSDLTLRYTDPLPENFRVVFDFCFLENPHLRLYLGNEQLVGNYFGTTIGKFLNGVAQFDFPNLERHWSYQAHMTRGVWHKLRLEMIDDTIRMFLDDVQILCAKDPFPPEYSVRCHLVIGAWQSHLQVRDLAIYDCGFQALVPAVRQVDALYNNSMYDRALAAYMRLLGAAAKPADIPELQYKVGMCYLQQQAFGQAQAWLSKVVRSDGDDFWFRMATHALLETCRRQGDFSQFLANARSLFANPANHDAVRACIERARWNYMDRGFFEKALGCSQLLFGLEAPNSLVSVLAENGLPEILFNLRRYREMVEHYENVIEKGNLPSPHIVWARSKQAEALSYSGNYEESEKVLQQIQQATKQQHDLAFCATIHGANLRGQERFDEAISCLAQMLEQFPDAAELGVFGSLKASHIFCMLGRPQKAIDLVNEMDRRFPNHFSTTGFYRSAFLYPPLFMERKYQEAAGILLTEAKRSGAGYLAADQMVRAGILFELAKEPDRAASVWSEVRRRFRSDQVCFYGDLAQSFIDKEDILEIMPYPAINRAEMFYLAGLLFRNRKEETGAMKCFRLAVLEDPTLNWFTWLAKKEVVSRQS